MNSKIIKKLLNYAKQNEIFDLTISQKDNQHLLMANDGLKSHQLKIPAQLENELASVFRHLASLAPQDLVSQAYFKVADSTLKLSIVPEESGEKVIINIINKSKKVLSLSHLGLGRKERHLIENFLLRRSGLIVVGAEDNQGVTTTLYSLLKRINREQRACYILEKNSELELETVNKLVSQKEQRLRDLIQVLKIDSEVIVIDDTSDDLLSEAVLAVKTGRLVILGVKSKGASEIIEKFTKLTDKKDLKTLIIFQKLIKTNCPKCLKAYLIGETEELINKYWSSEKKYKPKYFFSSQGCPKCQHTGTKGQIAVFNLVKLNKDGLNILSSLASDILQKAANGLISVSKFIEKHRATSIKKL